jgi:DNA-binding SARP family transcriptional activator
VDARILGPLEVWLNGEPVALGGVKQRMVLAVLLLRRGVVVSNDELVHQLWGDQPPHSAANTVQTYISRLRAVLEPDRPRNTGPQLLVTRPPGYLFQITDRQLDAARFAQLLEEGTAHLRSGQAELALERLRESLSLWRGAALADFPDAIFAKTERARLEGLRLVAQEHQIEAELALGRHRELIAPLEVLIREHPHQETMHRLLMLALYRSGRQADALGVYHQTRKLLADELGIDPSAELKAMHEAILHQSPELDWHPPGHRLEVNPDPPAHRADLFQLPPDLDDFVDRDAYSARVRALLQRDGHHSSTIVIYGKAGVGKSALAVHVAHEIKDRFPDGQLYASLRGLHAQVAEPADVLADFLLTLGVDPAGIPDRIDARITLYQTRLRGQRVLVMLDNAATESQIRPLLPRNAQCAVLVTSRRHLAGLEGAVTLELGVMEPNEAVELLAKAAGPERVSAEPQAAEEIVRLCGYLPLAVRIAGARLATKPHWRLGGYATRLRDERRRLKELRAGDLEVRASFALSYEELNPDEQRAFRLLGMLDSPNFPTWIAAALLGCSTDDAEEWVEQLVDAQLIEASAEDQTGRIRYHLHDLLRAFARDRLEAEEPAAHRQEALKRALSAYLEATMQAGTRLGLHYYFYQNAQLINSGQRGDSQIAQVVETDPLAWFSGEQDNLIAAVTQAHHQGLWQLCWELADRLAVLFEHRVQWSAWEHAGQLALDATRRAGDRRAEAYILLSIGKVQRWRRRLESTEHAGRHFDEALAIFTALGDQCGIAYARLETGVTHRYHGRLTDALADFERGLTLFHTIGDELGEAAALRNIGIVHRHQGRYQQAIDYLTRALAVFQRDRVDLAAARSLRHLGVIYRDCGRLDDALACTQQGLSLARQIGNQPAQAWALRSLGMVHLRLGRLDDAHTSLDECLAIVRELGDRGGEAWALEGLADIYLAEGRFEDARECYHRAVAVFRTIGGRVGAADSLLGLGNANAALGLVEEAMACFDQSLPVHQEAGLPLKVAKTLVSIGRLHAAAGAPDQAKTLWRQALEIFHELNAPEADDVRTLLQPPA